MSSRTYEEKKQILVRNVFAYVGGIILVILFILFAPLYDIFEEFKVTYIDNTLSQIMTRYVFVITVASFVIFTAGFYFIKKILLFFQERNARKIINNYKK